MNKSKHDYEWWDYSWNPIVGCSPVSEGCENCYAAGISKRFKLPWGTPEFKPERLMEPVRMRKPSRIFVCSVSDIFHEGVHAEWVDRVLEIIAACPQHTFMMLTKRPENIYRKIYEVTAERACRELGGGDYLPNLWLGVTAENQARADERISILLSVPAAKHFVSVEPMLGPVSLAGFDGKTYRPWLDYHAWKVAFDWVIAGPETGRRARECKPEWIMDVADQCKAAKVSFWDKSHGEFIRREYPREGGK